MLTPDDHKNKSENRAGTYTLYVFIFAISGFSGLIYESIWTHYLKLFLGHAAYAQTLVLAIFMGGMAIGAWYCSRSSNRWTNLFILYAIAEGLIGISAVLFHPLFTWITELSFTGIIPALANATLVTLYKWSLAAILILPQSILLGMTFPLMSSAIIRRFPKTPGSSISILYFSNSFGGAIGVLVSGFVLINWIGLPGTIFTAGCINILLATIIWSLNKNQPETPESIQQATVTIETENNTNTDITNRHFYLTLLSISLATGAASFIYEIGWIRMLSLVMGSSTHAFELMLSAFILGLALGGLWIRKRIDYIKHPVNFLAWVQIIMGLFALSTLILYGQSFNVMHWLLDNLDKTSTGYTLFNFSSIIIALTIMLPATFCAGMTLPLLTYSLIKKSYGEKSIGIIYSTNTVGAILGIVFAVHIGMPYLGLKNLIIFGAAIDIIAGSLLLWLFCYAKQNNSYIIKPAVATTIGSLCIIASIYFIELDSLKMASGVYRETGLLTENKDVILNHQDGKTASIDLTKKVSGLISIRTNGKTDAAIQMSAGGHYFPDEATMIMAAAIPLFIFPQAQNIAVIGLGSGLTSHTALQSRYALQVDTIEIEQKIVDVAKGFYPRNKAVYEDSRSRIHIEDAKTYFSTYNRQYDIIISEPSNPWVSGVAGLFSNEFYQLANRHLTKDGILVQWIQLYEIDLELVSTVLKALSANFDYYDIYIVNTGDMIITAKNNSPLSKLQGKLFNNANIARELRRIDINNIQDMELRKIGNKQSLQPLINSFYVSANSDYYPVLDQNAARTRFLQKNALSLMSIALEPIPALELLGIRKPDWQISNISATPHFQPSILANTAQLIRDQVFETANNRSSWFTQESSANNTASANQHNPRKIVQELNELLIECQTPEHGDKIFVLFGVALKTIPYLRPAELKQIWRRYEQGSCLTSWNTREQLWFKYIKAMSDRNINTISELSLELLSDKQDLTQARKKYLVASYMLANLALGKKHLAREAWQKYRHELFPEEEPRRLFKLLDLYSNE